MVTSPCTLCHQEIAFVNDIMVDHHFQHENDMNIYIYDMKMDLQKAEVPRVPAVVQNMAAVAAPSQKFRL